VYYLDLFSGIGGFALGAYWAGWRFDEHYYSEIDSWCIEIYGKRWMGAVSLGDIQTIEASKLPVGDWIITGGFPCQDISIAGKGEGISGARSGLWFEMWRIIRILRPRFVIIENVGAITFRGLDSVLSSLAEIGYDAEWQDIRASDVGAPHKRERIWIIAYSSIDIRRTSGNERPQAPNGSSKNMADTERKGSFSGITPKVYSQNKDRLQNKETFGDRVWGESTRCGIIRNERSYPGRWLTEPDVGRLAYGVLHRVDRLKGLGNSIVPQIAELLFRRIGEVMNLELT